MGERVICYGYRYYSPALGRWLSRDPASSLGARGLSVFAGNNPCTFWDYLGLTVNVTHDHPNPSKVVPTIVGREFFAGPEFFKPWETPDPLKNGGWTGYEDKSVVCRCDCVRRDGKMKCTMLCTVKWSARILLNAAYKRDIPWKAPLSMEGALGHEQRHVQGGIKLVEVKVCSPLRAKNVPDNTRDCNRLAGEWGQYYGTLLNMFLSKYHEKHRDRNPGDPAYDEQPNEGEYYPPLPDSPAIPE